MYGIPENDPLQAYLRAAWDAPMLSREREVELCAKMAQGGAVGKRARDELIVAHLKLAVKVARKWARGRSFEDLVQEANIGLCVAADKFEVERGFRFATCAWHWVNAQCQLFTTGNGGGGDIRIPLSRRREMRKVKDAMAALAARNEPVNDTTIAREMDCSVQHVRDVMETFLVHEVSLNKPIGDGDTEYGALLVDDSSPNAEEVLLEKDELERRAGNLAGAMTDALNDRERTVLTMRKDLDGEGERTLEEVAGVFSVSRERIRQIEVKAIAKLTTALTSDGTPPPKKRRGRGRPPKVASAPAELPPAKRRTRRPRRQVV